jgi:hypothetical protein
MNKKKLIEFFKKWQDDAIRELAGKKLVFPDDWPEDFAEESADYFCKHFGIKDDE